MLIDAYGSLVLTDRFVDLHDSMDGFKETIRSYEEVLYGRFGPENMSCLHPFTRHYNVNAFWLGSYDESLHSDPGDNFVIWSTSRTLRSESNICFPLSTVLLQNSAILTKSLQATWQTWQPEGDRKNLRRHQYSFLLLLSKKDPHAEVFRRCLYIDKKQAETVYFRSRCESQEPKNWC